MKNSTRVYSALLVAGVILLQGTAGVRADDDARASVTVSFGVGLNTAQPGNAANHHVLPRTIEVRAGGVVNFAVAGFHQIFVYNPGKGPDDVVPNVDPTALFINDTAGLYYRGILPAGGPQALPVTTNPSNAVNRIESVSFATPGRYLVICNVAPHFADGMWAWVIVKKGGNLD